MPWDIVRQKSSHKRIYFIWPQKYIVLFSFFNIFFFNFIFFIISFFRIKQWLCKVWTMALYYQMKSLIYALLFFIFSRVCEFLLFCYCKNGSKFFAFGIWRRHCIAINCGIYFVVTKLKLSTTSTTHNEQVLLKKAKKETN